MTQSLHSDQKTVVFEAYLAGRLTPAKHALISEYARLHPEVSSDMSLQDDVAGTFLTETEGEALSDGFMDKVTALLGDAADAPEKPTIDLTGSLDKITWRSRLPGIATHDVIGDRKQSGDRLYLLKMRAGMGVWEHAHSGDEWVLVLKGEYSSEGEIYKAGALHMEDAASVHALKAGEEEDCVCLVMTQGPVKMKSTLGKILAPYVGL